MEIPLRLDAIHARGKQMVSTFDYFSADSFGSRIRAFRINENSQQPFYDIGPETAVGYFSHHRFQAFYRHAFYCRFNATRQYLSIVLGLRPLAVCYRATSATSALAT